MGKKVRSFTWADLKQGGMWAWLIFRIPLTLSPSSLFCGCCHFISGTSPAVALSFSSNPPFTPPSDYIFNQSRESLLGTKDSHCWWRHAV